jgi:murein DD-endopeptidase MepM/ murein hydrolase activator NlpD
MFSRLNRMLGRIVPEQGVTVASPQGTLVFTLSPLAQVSMAGGALAVTGWLVASTSLIAMSAFEAGDAETRAGVLRSAYEGRIAELTVERDRYALEAQSARDRFAVALSEVASQQDALIAAMHEQQELASAVDSLRDRLSATLDERNDARTAYADLAEAHADVAGTIESGQSESAELRKTMDNLTFALEDVARARDAAATQKESLAMELAGLELEMQVNAERQDRMVSRLEEAVQIGFGPLEDVFEQSGVDVDQIVGSVRSAYSGTGGPLVVASASGRTFDDPDLDSRFQTLMQGMDRLNLMQIAAGKIPYAIPVEAGYRFTSGFGVRRDPKTGGRRAHNGIDLAGSLGTPVQATAEGVVIFAGRQSGFGNLIKVRHEFGFETLYAHLSRIRVDVGDRVSRGEHIGDMGNTGRSTGVHLHYEIRNGGTPVNPMTYIKAGRNVF